MLWLHGAPGHPHKIVAQRVEVRLVSQPGIEGFESLSGVVLAAVEASIHQRLDAASEGPEQGGYDEGGSHDGQGGLLPGEGAKDRLQANHAPDVDKSYRHGERSVDEGAVYQDVYVIQTVTQDGYPYGYGIAYARDREVCHPGALEPGRRVDH